MDKDTKHMIGYSLLLAYLVVMMYFSIDYVVKLRDDCQAKGGALVQGTMWPACIKGANVS